MPVGFKVLDIDPKSTALPIELWSMPKSRQIASTLGFSHSKKFLIGGLCRVCIELKVREPCLQWVEMRSASKLHLNPLKICLSSLTT